MIKQTAKPSTDPNYSSNWQVSAFVYALGYRIAEVKPNGIISTHSFDTFGKRVKTVADSAVGGLRIYELLLTIYYLVLIGIGLGLVFLMPFRAFNPPHLVCVYDWS